VIVASIAILLAPFLAYIYSPQAGLAIMAVALAVTAILLRSALDETALHRNGLRTLVGINLALAVACLCLLIVLTVHA
jgi:hypothetical protein